METLLLIFEKSLWFQGLARLGQWRPCSSPLDAASWTVLTCTTSLAPHAPCVSSMIICLLKDRAQQWRLSGRFCSLLGSLYVQNVQRRCSLNHFHNFPIFHILLSSLLSPHTLSNLLGLQRHLHFFSPLSIPLQWPLSTYCPPPSLSTVWLEAHT